MFAGTLAVLGYFIAMLADFPSASAELNYVTEEKWIDELGISYALGVDGLNLFMIGLTAMLWVAATLLACFREWDRPKLFFFHMALAETAVLGAFMAQDLALFVVFFDLMLVPFYFLIGAWGEYRRVPATMKLVIYTLAGSLLMLAGAIALGVLSGTDSGQDVSFLLSDLEQRTLGEDTQSWIFRAVRARVPGQDAGVPVPRLDARRLPRRAYPGADRLLRRAVEGRRLRLPEDRAADDAGRVGALPGGADRHRGHLDPVRVDPRLLPGQRAPRRRLLVDRAARVHHARDLRAERHRARRAR